MIFCDYIDKTQTEYSKVFFGDLLVMTTKRVNFREMPLTVATDEDNTIVIYLGKGFGSVQYCLDWKDDNTDTWVSINSSNPNYDSTSKKCSLVVNKYHSISVRGLLSSPGGSNGRSSAFDGTDFYIAGTNPDAKLYVYGNACSLMDPDKEDYKLITLTQNDNTFRGLFCHTEPTENSYETVQNYVYNINNLYLPRTNTAGCFERMFYKNKVKCLPKNLIKPDGDISGNYSAYSCRFMFGRQASDTIMKLYEGSLYATIYKSNCFDHMFAYSKIGSLPKLFTKTGGSSWYTESSCFSGMFRGCIFSNPNIYATTDNGNLFRTGGSIEGYFDLAEYACSNMFEGSNISSVVSLCSRMNNYACSGMFSNCTELTTVPANLFSRTTAITGHGQGVFSSIFRGCTSLTNAPKINSCYSSGTDTQHNVTLAFKPYMYSHAFDGCVSLTDLPEFEIPSGYYHIDTNAFEAMFHGCTGLTSCSGTTLPNHRDIPGTPTSQAPESAYMFQGCTNMTSAPEITADVAGDMTCMFDGCSKLVYVKTHFTGITDTHTPPGIDNWLRGVGENGNLTVSRDWTGTVSLGVPESWTITKI